MTMISRIAAAAASSAILAAAGAAAGQTTFVPLGNLGGNGSSYGWAISRDGATVVGGSPDAASNPNDAAFRFVGAGPIGVLAPGGNDLPGGNVRSTAFGVSATGAVSVGASAYSGLRTHAFKFGPGDAGLVDLGNIAPQTPPLAAASDISLASAVSDDGSVIVGRGFRQATNSAEACYWLNGAPGAIGIGDLPGGTVRSDAHGVSGNGLVIVGEAQSASGREAFRWTQAGGMVALPSPPGPVDSTAYAASSDGSVIVGYVTTAVGTAAARWTSGALRVLGDLSGGAEDAVALACSASGAVVVGSGDAGRREEVAPGFFVTVYEAFIWDVRSGFRKVSDVLGAALPAGWVLNEANGVTVTSTATIVVGTATNPAGDSEAYKAVLPRFCVADFNNSGDVTVQDIFDFLAAYFANNPAADANGSGVVTIQDIFDFLAAYFGGC